MEPVTHLLTGACLSRSGLNRRTAYATMGMTIAAEFPDIDTFWGLRGPISGFEHHRGITHTLVGVPFEAALLLLAFFVYDRVRHRAPATEPADAGGVSLRGEMRSSPVRWGILYALLVIALLSHLLLDFTNNYGLRPFFPFDDRWYAGSIVFIFDPLLFVILVAGLTLPALFGLIGREVGVRRERYRGRGWACAALMGVALLWAVRWVEHGRAVALAQMQTLRGPGQIDVVAAGDATETGAATEEAQTGVAPESAAANSRPLLQPIRSLASPDPLSVFRWYSVTDYGVAYRLGTIDTRVGTSDPGRTFVKPAPSPPLTAAEESHLGRVYMDWSPMPILTSEDGVPDSFEGQVAGDERTYRTVTFTDPRFMGDMPWLHRGGHPPLTGEVVLNQADHVVGEAIDGQFGR